MKPRLKGLNMNQHYSDFLKLIREAAHQHSLHEVFHDFCHMAAISISNAVDWPQADRREAAYMRLAERHTRHLHHFPNMLAHLTLALEEKTDDYLGRAFHALELANRWKGQFFTPFPVCQMLAKMQVSDATAAIIERQGFIRANEPACGSGAMVMALCEAMRESDINYQHALHVVAQDIDARAVHMAYLQLSLLHCPAVVIVGDTLALEEREHWRTPAHVVGLWDTKLAQTAAVPQPAAVPEPEHPAIREQLTLFA